MAMELDLKRAVSHGISSSTSHVFLGGSFHWFELWFMGMVKKNMTGWWFFATPLKNDGVSNSWDEITFPIFTEKIKAMFQYTEKNKIQMFQSPPTSHDNYDIL